MFYIAFNHVKSSLPDLTFFAAAIFDFSTAILKIGQYFDWLRINIQITHAHEHFYQFFMLTSACAFFLSLSALLNI